MKACKDCTEREVGCHANCERYRAEVERQKEINAARCRENFGTSIDILRNIRRQKAIRAIRKRRQGY